MKNKFGNTAGDDCIWVGFILVFIIIIMISFGGYCGANRNIISTFVDSKYSEWEKQMDNIKSVYDIGNPGGVLSYNPDIVSCETISGL